MIRLVIADDHAVVREGVKRILADRRDLQVVGEARTTRELFAIVARRPCDVVLLELLLPDHSGLEVLQEFTQRFPTLPVLVFTVQTEPHYAVRAFKAGAAGFLTKSSLPQELVRAIRKVAQGDAMSVRRWRSTCWGKWEGKSTHRSICASPIESTPCCVGSPQARRSKNWPPTCQ